jgi:hypothetical protein
MRYKVCNCGGIDFDITSPIIKSLLQTLFPDRNWNKCTHWIELREPME